MLKTLWTHRGQPLSAGHADYVPGGREMRARDSYVGPQLTDRSLESARRKGEAARKKGIVTVSIALAILALLSAYMLVPIQNTQHPARMQTSDTLPLVLAFQHHDSAMPCTPCIIAPLPVGPHAWNDAKGLDGVYGTPDDCPHCSAYCAPASISMIAVYRGIAAPANHQDDIYDSGKTMNGEIMGNGNIESHGVGMFHGVGGTNPEVQTAMIATLGVPIVQHNQSDASKLTAAQLGSYIHNSRPVLWLDNGGWPKNQSANFPPDAYKPDQGHAKVIGGYDDRDTGDTSDDRCLIYDPWPEYTDMGFLPKNATKGPGDTFDPYWLPLNDVNLSDVADVYLVDTFPNVVIGEFPTALMPVLVLVVLAVVISRRSRNSTSRNQP